MMKRKEIFGGYYHSSCAEYGCVYQISWHSCEDVELETTNVNLVVALKEKSTVRLFALGTMDVCTKMDGNTSNS